MAHKTLYNIHTDAYTLDVKCDNGMDMQDLHDLVDLYASNGVLIAEHEVDQFGGPPSTDYIYKITTTDGRVWDQDMSILDAMLDINLVKMNFNVVSMFTTAEFSPWRELRDMILKLVLQNQLVKLKYNKL